MDELHLTSRSGDGCQIDEEELYSSVARGEAVPTDEDTAAPAADAANDLTFGSDAGSSKPASSSGRDAADGPRKAAWANAGAGVAAVSGRRAPSRPLHLFGCLFSTLQGLYACWHTDMEFVRCREFC